MIKNKKKCKKNLRSSGVGHSMKNMGEILEIIGS